MSITWIIVLSMVFTVIVLQCILNIKESIGTIKRYLYSICPECNNSLKTVYVVKKYYPKMNMWMIDGVFSSEALAQSCMETSLIRNIDQSIIMENYLVQD